MLSSSLELRQKHQTLVPLNVSNSNSTWYPIREAQSATETHLTFLFRFKWQLLTSIVSNKTGTWPEYHFHSEIVVLRCPSKLDKLQEPRNHDKQQEQSCNTCIIYFKSQNQMCIVRVTWDLCKTQNWSNHLTLWKAYLSQRQPLELLLPHYFTNTELRVSLMQTHSTCDMKLWSSKLNPEGIAAKLTSQQ